MLPICSTARMPRLGEPGQLDALLMVTVLALLGVSEDDVQVPDKSYHLNRIYPDIAVAPKTM